MASAEARAVAEAVLGKVGLKEKIDAYPDQLSAASSSAWRSRGRSPCSQR